jgi:hypothetical protein
MHGVAGRVGHREVAGDGVSQLVSHHRGPLILHEAGLREPVAAQDLLEEGAVELSVRAPEAGLLEDRPHDEVVRHRETELLGLLVHDRLGDEGRGDPLVDAEQACLFGRDHRPELAAEALQLVIVGLAEGLRRDGMAADRCDRRRGLGAEDVADPPDREAHDQQHEEDRGDTLADHRLAGMAQSAKHEILFPSP